MADYEVALGQFAADATVQGTGATMVCNIAGTTTPPDGTEEWYLSRSDKIDAWLQGTHDKRSCVEVAYDTFTAARPLFSQLAVLRLRIMFAELYTPFPDCLVTAVSRVLAEYNGTSTPTSRTAMQLVRLCDAYVSIVGRVQILHRQIHSTVKQTYIGVLRKWLEHPEERGVNKTENAMLAQLFNVDQSDVARVLDAYIAEAERTMWVTQGTPL
jgi:hypothetical protein